MSATGCDVPALAKAAVMDYVGDTMNKMRNAKYTIGQVVKHRLYPFRGVVFDIDPVFDNTDEWWEFDPGGDPPA